MAASKRPLVSFCPLAHDQVAIYFFLKRVARLDLVGDRWQLRAKGHPRGLTFPTWTAAADYLTTPPGEQLGLLPRDPYG